MRYIGRPDQFVDACRKRPWALDGVAEAPLHSIVSRLGAFPPRMVRFFIKNLTRTGDLVIDPFSGKGTTVLESLLQGRRALGSDAAPDAAIITAAKADPVSYDEFASYLRGLKRRLNKLSVSEVSDVDDNLRIFFHPVTLNRIKRVKKCLLRDVVSRSDETRRLARYAQAVVLGILHGKSKAALSVRCSHAYSMSPGYVREYVRRHNRSASLRNRMVRPVRDVLACMAAWAKKISLPKNQVRLIRGKGDWKWSDAARFNDDRSLTGRCGLIITSPPYLSAQTYLKDNWLRLWFLGYDRRELRPSMYLVTADVNKYQERFRPIMLEIFTALRAGRYCVIVVGDVPKKRYRSGEPQLYHVNLARLMGKEAKKVGFDVIGTVADRIPSHRKTSRTFAAIGIEKDRILLLRKPRIGKGSRRRTSKN